MSILEKIRSKTGLLVGIIGLALIIFILESLLGSGSALFSGQDRQVGKIDGDKVDVIDFKRKVDEQILQIQKANPQAQVDEKMKEQIIDQVWNTMVNDKIIKVEFKKLGISVSPDELYDLMVTNPHPYVVQQITDQQTGKVYEQFARPDGSADPAKLNAFINQMTPEQEQFWKQLEQSIIEYRTAEKYNNLIKKGMYVTSAEAKAAFANQNKQSNVQFVMKRYSSVSDSTVKVSDSDVENYYTKNQNKYKVKETSRKVEYIAYDVMPSKADFEALQKDAMRIAEDFKTKTTLAEDSSFIAQENPEGEISIATYTKKNMVVPDSSVYVSPKGTVFGPYTEGTFIKVYKLENVKSVADSAKVRHILIATQSQRTKQQRSLVTAKRIADSLLVLLKSKQVSFDSIVKSSSDDMGSLDKGGDYGWFDENKGFVEPFKNAGLEGAVGNITVVPTQFGYHIIEVLAVSKTRHTSYSIASISRLIAPSNETTQEYFQKANNFANQNQTADAFNKSIDEQKLNKRIADNIKENDKTLPGITEPKEFIRWVYQAKKGDISTVYTFKDRFVVAHLVSIKEKGIATFEEVKEDAKANAIKDKKAEVFMSEFASKASGAKSANEVATKMGLSPETSNNLTFASFNIGSGLNREDALIGAVAAMKVNSISAPIKGDNGVFVVNVTSVTETAAPTNLKAKQQELEQMSAGRVDYELFEALKDKANIEDHRGKFDF